VNHGNAHRSYSPLPALNLSDSVVIRGPERGEPGYWSGCPGVLYEPARGRYVLTYRQRRPRGHEGGDRGWRCAIAVSDDGVEFDDIWTVDKTDLGAASMERMSLLPRADGYQLYLSYVDPADSRWRIDVVEAATVDAFDIRKAEPVLTADTTDSEGVKDPYVVQWGPVVYLYASFAKRREFSTDERARAHATADIYNVGVTTAGAGLATSLDGRTFSWRGEVLDTGDGWDRYQVRLNSIVPIAGAFLGFYDGAAVVDENYEERCGLAISHDLETWSTLTPDEPWVVAPHATGSVRYVDALVIDRQWHIYFEMTRPDGAHELRLCRVAAG
jgi:hypothetical protein